MPITADTPTLLEFDNIGVPPYSARGITQSLGVISQAAFLKRSVNGEMHDLSSSQFQKYKLSLSCQDQDPPAIDGVWPGLTVIVDCIEELCYRTANGGPGRTIVAGSSRVSGSYTFYRPKLTCCIMDFNVQKNEWDATVSWSMELEEI